MIRQSLWVVVVVAACGGTVDNTGASAGGAGGGCGDFATCCGVACVTLAECPVLMGPCSCDLDFQSKSATCRARLFDAYRCMATQPGGAYACNPSGTTAFRCGTFCGTQITAVTQACGGAMIACAP